MRVCTQRLPSRILSSTKIKELVIFPGHPLRLINQIWCRIVGSRTEVPAEKQRNWIWPIIRILTYGTNARPSITKLSRSGSPIDILPLYVKAGSILPIGPEVQYSTEKSWDNLEIKVYPGCNGEFTLYEDENDNYNYEKGMYSTITMKWNDRTRMLTIENRKGEFSGMLKERKFNIVTADGTKKAVAYNGKKVTVKM